MNGKRENVRGSLGIELTGWSAVTRTAHARARRIWRESAARTHSATATTLSADRAGHRLITWPPIDRKDGERARAYRFGQEQWKDATAAAAGRVLPERPPLFARRLAAGDRGVENERPAITFPPTIATYTTWSAGGAFYANIRFFAIIMMYG